MADCAFADPPYRAHNVVCSCHPMDRIHPLDHAAHIGGGAGFAEIKPLHGGAARFPHKFELLGRLDAFRRGLDAEIGAQIGDRANDRGAFMGEGERADEGAVNLDHVEGEFSQVAQR